MRDGKAVGDGAVVVPGGSNQETEFMSAGGRYQGLGSGNAGRRVPNFACIR